MPHEFTQNGKEVLHLGEHFADAENENGAELICLALNSWDGTEPAEQGERA